MITYEELLQELFSHADEGYRAFHKKLLKDDTIAVIGVRIPVLRAIAKKNLKGSCSLCSPFRTNGMKSNF